MAEKYRDYPLSYYREQYIDIGIMRCLSGDIHGGRKALRRAISLFPIQVKGYVNLCLTLFGPQAFAKAKAIIWNARSFFTRAGDHFEQSAHPKN